MIEIVLDGRSVWAGIGIGVFAMVFLYLFFKWVDSLQ